MEGKQHELSPRGRRALELIRALRRLPETEVTVRAEKRILDGINIADTIAVAVELAKDEGTFDEQAGR